MATEQDKNTEKGGWNDLNAVATLFLMLEGAKDEQGNRICPLCRQVKLDEKHKLVCEKCEKEKIDIYKEKSNMKKLLVVVDMQNDFINGSLGTKEAQAIVPNVKAKIEEYHRNKQEIIFTRDTHHLDYLETQEGRNLPVEHCIKGTEGWKIADVLNADKMATYEHIDKPSFGFTKWNLYNSLAEYDEIELVGLCTDICVISNALLLKAFYPEIKITVDASCCAGVTPQSHKNALEAMKMCQINIIGE